jgi:hypothetical protein
MYETDIREQQGSLAQEPTRGAYSTTEEIIHDWRLQEFLRLGFSPTQAEQMASLRWYELEVEAVRRLLDLDCPRELARSILL